ncbi:MAG TPA: hypothetical protein VHD57_02600 [Vicinamibacterales bacterium]|nr:hypothetical protein [Vicinamibacterales bacterium]
MLKIVAEHDATTQIVILTHNIEFLFIESLLLTAARKGGNPSLTVFADAQCATGSYARERQQLTQLGRRYRVAPVQMQPGFRFHPKALFLSGPESATLIVGSGNLTFGGWQDNAEVWCQFSTDEGLREFTEFRDYLNRVLERVPLREAIAAEVGDAFSESKHKWASGLGESAGLIGRCGVGPQLQAALHDQLSGREVDDVTIVSPYFDASGEVANVFASASAPKRVRLFVPQQRSNLTREAVESLPAAIEVVSTQGRLRDGSASPPFVHAKVFAFRSGGDVLTFIGSANCSRAALTCEGALGNAELMAVRSLTEAQFESEVLGEIEVVPGTPTLFTPGEQERTERPPAVRITAARLDQGLLRVGFVAPGDAIVEAALVDDIESRPVRTAPGACECHAPVTSRSVYLIGTVAGMPFQTASFWIDDEASLAITATRRSLDRMLRKRATRQEWDLGDWQEVVKVFCADLEYVQGKRLDRPVSREAPSNGARRFTREQAFPPRTPWPSTTRARTAGTPDDPGTSLERLLMNWFLRAEGSDLTDEALRDRETVEDDDTDTVDAPTSPLTAGDRQPPKQQPITRDGRRKAQRLLGQIVAAMTSADYLETRHPADLAKDLRLAALVIRMGRSKGWLTSEDVIAASCRIWVPLFVSDGGGAIGARRTEDRSATEQFLESPSLAAALFAWSLELPEPPSTPTAAQGWVVLALAVARHPWLWSLQDVQAVERHLCDLLRATSVDFSDREISARWSIFTRLGEALFELEACLDRRSLPQWTAQNEWKDVAAGDLVWQGGLGYCVTLTPATRAGSQNVQCLPVETISATAKRLAAKLLNPVRDLLTVPEVASSLTSDQSAAIVELLLSVRVTVLHDTREPRGQ